jgi:hypothetical protein
MYSKLFVVQSPHTLTQEFEARPFGHTTTNSGASHEELVPTLILTPATTI